MKILLAAIYPYIFMLLYLIIPFDEYIRALPNILLGILVFAFPLIVKKEDFKKLIKKPTLLFLLFFFFLVFNSLFFGRIEEDFYIIKKILISVGLVLLYIPIQDFNKINKVIIFSSLIVILYTLYTSIININTAESFEFSNYLTDTNLLLIDNVYIGLLCVLSILISYQSISREYHPRNNYYVANIIINIAFIVLIASKVAALTLLIIFILKQFYGKNKKIKIMVTAGGLLILAGAIFLSKDNLKEIIFNPEPNITEKDHRINTIDWGTRVFIWNCAHSISTDMGSNFFGIGFKSTADKLLACYDESLDSSTKKEAFLLKKYNTHNQFLDFYLSTGLIGLLLFLGILIALFVKYRKHFFPVALLVSIIIFFLSENLFHRQIGAYYFGFMLIILLINNTFFRNIEENNEHIS